MHKNYFIAQLCFSFMPKRLEWTTSIGANWISAAKVASSGLRVGNLCCEREKEGESCFHLTVLVYHTCPSSSSSSPLLLSEFCDCCPPRYQRKRKPKSVFRFIFPINFWVGKVREGWRLNRSSALLLLGLMVATNLFGLNDSFFLLRKPLRRCGAAAKKERKWKWAVGD